MIDPRRLPGTRRWRSALAWGLVGTLSFLVGHQAYLLAGGRFLGIAPVAGVALLVGVLSGGLSYALAGLLRRAGRTG